jgi:diguanylate cyclase (GGDEF)-like protein
MTKLRDHFDRTVAWLKGRSRAQADLAVIAAVTVPLYLILFYVNAFDLFHEWSRAHESWQLDEIIVLAFFLGLAAMAFSWRRLLDLKREKIAKESVEQHAFVSARRDPLTGLANRRCFVEEISKWAYRLPADKDCAVFILDLDRFKPINDLYGHRLGDEVLRVVASRVGESLEENGLVARLAGDEFGILMLYDKDTDAPARLARRIVTAISQPISLASLSIEVGVSVGVAVCDQESAKSLLGPDGSHVEALIRQADMAMYRAKTEGRGRYRFFNHAMDEKLQARLGLESQIGCAISNGEIVPYYQPLVELRTKATIGYEVLARWQHPERGLLPPSEFIAIAEDTGAIIELTDALLRQALKQAKSWESGAYVSFNLSPRQFADPWLTQRILAAVNEAGFPPQRLVLELTETALVEKLEEAKSALQSLRNLGVRVALDDFGTGHGGLYHLRVLTFDIVKIDRSFIGRMMSDPQEAKIVEALIAIGRILGLEIAAEGIETQAVLDKLIALGCNLGQGYLFGKPRPFAELPASPRRELKTQRTA